MTIITCPSCGSKVPSTKAICPHCGYELRKNANGGALLALALALAIIFAPIVIVLGLFGKFLLKGLYKNILGLKEFKKFRKTYTIICFSWFFLSIAFCVVAGILLPDIVELAFYVLCGGNIALFVLSIVFGNKIYKKHKDDIPTDSNTASEDNPNEEVIESEDSATELPATELETEELPAEESSNDNEGARGLNEYGNKKKIFELLAELAALRDANVLTEEEFNEQKKQILNAHYESAPKPTVSTKANVKKPTPAVVPNPVSVKKPTPTVEDKTVSVEKPNVSQEKKQAPSKKKKKVFAVVCAAVLAVGVVVGIIIVATQHTHHFEDVIIAPTCEEEGYTKHVCDCGEWYSDTIVDSTGHSFENGFCLHCDSTEFRYTLSSAGDSYILESGANGNMVILSEYNGLPVTGIGDKAFYGCSGLTSVTIPDSVTSIGAEAFYGCSGLTSVTIPDSVTSIGAYAFSGCTLFTSITIPDSVTSIGESVFSDCSSIEEITLPFVGTTEDTSWNTQLGGIFGFVCMAGDNSDVPSSLKKVTITSATSIGDYAFYNCDSLESITIPESVASIGDSAFAECAGLTEINFNATDCLIDYEVYTWNAPFKNSENNGTGFVLNIGDNVKHIPGYLFCESAVSSVTIGKGVTSIGDNAFAYCDSLTSVIIPSNVKSIGDEVFFDCKNLTEVTIEEGVTRIGNNAFSGCSALTEIVIPNSIESIGYAAFYACNNLCYYSEDNLNYLGNHTNRYLCLIEAPRGIATVTINNNCRIICDSAFYDCSSLISVIIPDSVTSIGNYAFSGCSSLESITIPDGVISIGDFSFRSCKSLTSIVIPDSVTSIGYHAFYWCEALTIYCEASSKPSGWHSNWNCVYDNSVNAGETYYLPVFWAGEWRYDANGIPVPLNN